MVGISRAVNEAPHTLRAKQNRGREEAMTAMGNSYDCALLSATILILLLVSAAQGAMAQTAGTVTQGPRVLVRYDMEGLAGQDDWRTAAAWWPKRYAAGQKLLAADVNAVVAGLFDGGAGVVDVVDQHGSGNPGFNLPTQLLDPRVRKHLHRHDAPEEQPGAYEAVVMVGMHAKTGSGGFMAHTGTFGIERWLNGRSVSEAELGAYAWGEAGIPVIFVSGDDRLRDDLAPVMPWIEYVVTKRSLSPASVELRPESEVRAELRIRAAVAVRRLGSAQALRLATPIRAALRAVPPSDLSLLGHVPGIRYAEHQVSFEAVDFREAMRGLRALQWIASVMGGLQIAEHAMSQSPLWPEIERIREAAIWEKWIELESQRAIGDSEVKPEPRSLAQDSRSPRLRQLQQELRTGSTTAMDRFWAEIARDGSPLAEPIAGDSSMLLVTFLWRDRGHTRHIVIFSGHTNTLYEFSREQLVRNSMRRLEGTDVWYRSYLLPADARFTYYLSPNDDFSPSVDVTDWDARTRTWRNDPLNPHEYRRPHEDREWVASLVELPHAPPLPWIERRVGVPRGSVEEHRFRSALLGNERRIWVYTPAGYTRGDQSAHLLMMFDGWATVHRLPTLAILDNLHASGRIRPTIAVMVDPVDRAAELGCSQRFSDFLADELLPWVRGRYSATRDPRETILSGGSRGGLAAACAALWRPEVFGNVFSAAGQFAWRAGDSELEEDNARADAEYGWVMREYAKRPRQPVRFYLSVGRFDRGGDYPRILANRHFRDVLVAKGYSVDYREMGGGHEDANPTLAEMLLSFFGREWGK